MRGGLDAALPRLLEVIEDPATPTRDLIAAVGVLARYGMNSKDEELDESVQLEIVVRREWNGDRHSHDLDDEPE